MSSDLFLLDESFIRHSSSDHMASSSDLDMQFLSDHLFPFEDPQSDDHILQAISIDSNLQIQIDLCPSLYQFTSSPPSQAFNNLSIGSTNKLNSSSIPISAISSNGIARDHFPLYETLGVKSEDCYGSGFSSYSYNHPSLLHKHSYFTEKFMQRSLSSRSLDRKPRFFNQHCFNSLLQTPSFDSQVVGSPENSELTGNIRRVCSAGDIQRIKMAELNHVQSPSQFVAENSSSPSSCLFAENSFTEEGSFKVRRYNAEERKQRINRYRSKRTQRNFNKTIKYACRKTLADSRHRVRGRFARNDETGEIPKVAGLNREEEDEDELWHVEGLYEEEEEIVRRAGAFNNCSETQFQYFSY